MTVELQLASPRRRRDVALLRRRILGEIWKKSENPIGRIDDALRGVQVDRCADEQIRARMSVWPGTGPLIRHGYLIFDTHYYWTSWGLPLHGHYT